MGLGAGIELGWGDLETSSLSLLFQVSSYIRDHLSLPEVAEMFRSKRIDSRAACQMEREDLTLEEPAGFGIAEDDPRLEAIWGFLSELQRVHGSQSSFPSPGY